MPRHARLWLAADPALGARLARQQALASRLRAAFDDVLEEPLPPRLLAAARATASVVTSASTAGSCARPARPRRPGRRVVFRWRQRLLARRRRGGERQRLGGRYGAVLTAAGFSAVSGAARPAAFFQVRGRVAPEPRSGHNRHPEQPVFLPQRPPRTLPGSTCLHSNPICRTADDSGS